MKARFITLGILLILGSLILTSAVYAPWETLGTGYAITSNVHGIDIPPGMPVTVTAGTLDSNVVQVTFRWHEPPDGNGPVRWEVTVPIFTNGTTGQWNDGTTALIRYAQDTQTPDLLGDWGVQAFFQDSTGNDRAGLANVIKIRATSFNAIPEIPFGTIAAAAAMFIAFGLFTVKKKRIPRIMRRVN
ncbi:MAG: hypothetical protein ACUVRA_05090 [Candidatus Bathyarchaeaceae archaeon]